MGKRLAIVIGVAASGVMALGAQPAAAVVKYETELTISKDRGSFYHGLVRSEVRRCAARRRVALFKPRPGADRRLGGALSVIGDDPGPPYTAGWGVIAPRQGLGAVYARVKSKVLRNGDVCLRDRTPNFDPHGRIP